MLSLRSQYKTPRTGHLVCLERTGLRTSTIRGDVVERSFEIPSMAIRKVSNKPGLAIGLLIELAHSLRWQ